MTVCLIVLVLYTAGVQSDSDSSAVNNKMSGQSNVKPNRPSLAKILLSLDGNLAKQQALSHVLSALQIMYARYVVYVSSPGGSEDCDAHHVTTTKPVQVWLFLVALHSQAQSPSQLKCVWFRCFGTLMAKVQFKFWLLDSQRNTGQEYRIICNVAWCHLYLRVDHDQWNV